MPGMYFEEFVVGQEFHHAFTRTVTEMDNTMFSLLSMNPQPLHIDAHFSEKTEFGQRLFNSNNWLDKWDGKFKGKPCEMGTYVWILSYVNLETGKFVEQKGSTVLIR